MLIYTLLMFLFVLNNANHQMLQHFLNLNTYLLNFLHLYLYHQLKYLQV
jgi:hypothetical protein